MWDGYLGQMSICKHLIKITLENAQPIQSAQYWAAPKSQQLVMVEIDKILFLRFTKPTQAESAARIVFSPKKGWISMVLYGWQIIESRNETYLIPENLYRRVHWLPWDLCSVLLLRCKHWLLTSRGKKNKSKKKQDARLVVDLLRSSNAFWIKEWPRKHSARYECRPDTI